MATMRRGESKAALRQQRAAIRRGARGKAHVGDDSGAAAAKAAERAKVHRMQERYHERAAAERRREPLSAILGDLLTDTLRLSRTLVSAPFRIAAALRRAAADPA
jgi:hypothetical protein